MRLGRLAGGGRKRLEFAGRAEDEARKEEGHEGLGWREEGSGVQAQVQVQVQVLGDRRRALGQQDIIVEPRARASIRARGINPHTRWSPMTSAGPTPNPLSAAPRDCLPDLGTEHLRPSKRAAGRRMTRSRLPRGWVGGARGAAREKTTHLSLIDKAESQSCIGSRRRFSSHQASSSLHTVANVDCYSASSLCRRSIVSSAPVLAPSHASTALGAM